jgi:hypothetical protein
VTDYEIQKDAIENSIKLVQQLRELGAYSDEIKWELDSIEKFYKSKLYDLRHVEV